MRLFLAGVLTANNSQQMPISYLSNTSHLLKGLCQGKLSQIFLYQILRKSHLEASVYRTQSPISKLVDSLVAQKKRWIPRIPI